jgi:peptidyl-prolyl cis-trans isomerase A (cyclophilin A)
MAGCAKKEAVQKEKKSEPAKQISAQILNPDPTELNQPAPTKFQVKFETSRGDFVVEVYRDWSPYGADRFYYLIKNGFYNNVRFFRVVAGFMAQFGYHGDPQVTSVWSEMNFPDDPVKQSNLRGNVTFAKRGVPNSRTTNIFINLVDNAYLDQMGFSPIGKVVEGMAVVDQLYSGYGDGPPQGNGPEQGRIAQEGNEYLNKNFPNLDYIKKATLQ